MNPAGGTGGSGRDGWCTPLWLAELIGEVDLDPCSNVRSHIASKWRCIVDWGSDGLDPTDPRPGAFWYGHSPESIVVSGSFDVITGRADESWTVFVNPPYSRGQVGRWVSHYGHTRFIFLLRWDPSTVWFSELLPRCTHVWFPTERINFEPPPGVEASSNPFPHALYLRDPEVTLLRRLATRGYLVPLDGWHHRTYGGPHVESTHHPCTRHHEVGNGAGGEALADAAAPGGSAPDQTVERGADPEGPKAGERSDDGHRSEEAGGGSGDVRGAAPVRGVPRR